MSRVSQSRGLYIGGGQSGVRGLQQTISRGGQRLLPERGDILEDARHEGDLVLRREKDDVRSALGNHEIQDTVVPLRPDNISRLVGESHQGNSALPRSYLAGPTLCECRRGWQQNFQQRQFLDGDRDILHVYQYDARRIEISFGAGHIEEGTF